MKTYTHESQDLLESVNFSRVQETDKDNGPITPIHSVQIEMANNKTKLENLAHSLLILFQRFCSTMVPKMERSFLFSSKNVKDKIMTVRST